MEMSHFRTHPVQWWLRVYILLLKQLKDSQHALLFLEGFSVGSCIRKKGSLNTNFNSERNFANVSTTCRCFRAEVKLTSEQLLFNSLARHKIHDVPRAAEQKKVPQRLTERSLGAVKPECCCSYS